MYIYNSLFCSDFLFKMVLVGDDGVGKSCLMSSFAVSKPRKYQDHYKNKWCGMIINATTIHLSKNEVDTRL